MLAGLCEDCNGNILIGTDRGVVLYDHETDSMNPLDGLSCRVYTMCSDGEALKERNDNLWALYYSL